MKIIEFYNRITKNYENPKMPQENQKSHANHKIPNENQENQ